MIDCAPHIHIAAYHADESFNRATVGLGMLCPIKTDVRASVGTYYNSIRDVSVYAAIVYQPLHVGSARVGAFGGFVTGYKPYAMPFGAAVVSVPFGNAEWHVIVIPPVPHVTPTTAELSVSFKF